MDRLLLLVTGFTLVSLAHCCSDKVIACEDEFLARVGTTRLTFEAGIIPEMTVRRLSRVCSAFDEFADCTDPHLSSCALSIPKYLFLGLTEMYNYICNEGFKDHVQHADCLGKNETEPRSVACFENMKAKLSRAFIPRSKICSIINEELECVVGVAQDVCGTAAAIHRRDLEALAIKPAADAYLCEIRLMPLKTTTTMFPFFTTTTGAHPSTITTGVRSSTTTSDQNKFSTTTALFYTTTTTEQLTIKTGELKNKDSKEKLSKADAFGVGITVMIVLLILITAIVLFVLRRHKERITKQQSIGFANPGYPVATPEPAQLESADHAPAFPGAKPLTFIGEGYTNEAFGNGAAPADQESGNRTLTTNTSLENEYTA